MTSLCTAATPDQLNTRVKAQDYFDLALTYTMFDMVSLRAGVNNIFDKSPPIIPTGTYGSCPSASCAGNTYPQTWDYLGRFLYAGATVDFKHKPTPIAPPPVIAPPPPPPPAAPATITCPDGLVILANQSLPGASAAASAAGSGARARSVSDRANLAGGGGLRSVAPSYCRQSPMHVLRLMAICFTGDLN